ncbi:MAG: GNAT family N-acetyltransferase [Thermoplasmata archaeon]
MIREMTSKDVDQVLLLRASQSNEDQKHSGGKESFEDILRRRKKIGIVKKYEGEIVHLVEEREGEVVGHCAVSIRTDGETVMGEMSAMYVKPEHRRKGIALGLINRMTEVAREKGASVIFAWTRHEAEAAKALYEKAGYEEHAQPIYYRIMDEGKPAGPSRSTG